MLNPLRFEIIADPQKAKELWELFSPHKKLDDEWDFRNTWTSELKFPLHFIAGYDDDKPVGLLPLQLNTLKGLGPKLLEMDKPFLEFFGGVDTDDNEVITLPGYEKTVESFIRQVKEPAVLTSLKEKYPASDFYLDRYQINLDGVVDFASYVDKNFTGKTRRNIRSELKEKRFSEYKIELKDGTKKDLNLLFDFSIQRFGKKSSFHMEQRRNVYKNLFDLFNVDLFLILLNGLPKAAVYAIVYKNTYVGINTGYDYSIPNLGKLVFTSSVLRAIRNKCTIYDVGQGSSKWKEQLHVPKIPQYKLVLNL